MRLDHASGLLQSAAARGNVDGGVAAIEAPIGKGKVLLFGPEILKRAQPHGTFKFLFNGVYLGASTAASMSTSEAARD